jgi:adenine-specific DNA-methyltransferase
MANGRQKLELTWIGKDDRPRLEPRILIEDPSKSYHASARRPGDHFDNMLIFGDNLLALKALESEYVGKVKCVFIDPPYNTGSAFKHYDDGLEHSTWLSLMRDRIEIIRNLLSTDGSLWITADDNEAHYLKVVCDEIFGRSNFVANSIWQKKYAPSNDALWLSENHDHILVYAKDKALWRPRLLPRTDDQNKLYKNLDSDPRGPWMSDNYTCAKSADERPNLFYPISNPNTGEEIWPNRARVWGFERKTHEEHVAQNRIYWGKDGTNSTPRLKKFLSELKRNGTVPQTIWTFEEVGHTQDAKREASALIPSDPFPTPKPERLAARILEIGSSPGDLVLDSFAGSGTTGAVAHKMGRRWIMVELGAHCRTHIIPRLQKVIDGADKGGVTQVSNWKGGGGFRYFRLAPSLLERDKYGNWVISKDYNPAMLAEAMCKHLGFTYAPSEADYWNHGHSTETDFIYVTTQKLTHDALRRISEDVGPDRTLLVCCKAFSSNTDRFDNLTVVKIPQSILKKCEWGRDDYSLAIAKLPEAADDAEEDEAPPPSKTLPLFADADDEDEEV